MDESGLSIASEPMLREKDADDIDNLSMPSAGESARTVAQERTRELTESKSDGEQLADEVREQRQQVVVRNSSFTNKARPVSTTSIESSGLHTQGSVKRKDARPPSIMEAAESTASLSESIGSSTSQPRFQRRQHISTERTKSSHEVHKVSLENSLPSYSRSTDCLIFQSGSPAVTCSYECHWRVTRLEERIKVLEQTVYDQQRQIKVLEHNNIVQNKPPSSTYSSRSDLDIPHVQHVTRDGKDCVATVKMPVNLCDKQPQYSTPFFSDREESGYQMCILMDKQTSTALQLCSADLSFSLVLMRGKHDKELQWPFNRKVEFTIISQCHAKSFPITVPPKFDKRYERPKSDLNKPIFFLSSPYAELVRDGWIINDTIEFSVAVRD